MDMGWIKGLALPLLLVTLLNACQPIQGRQGYAQSQYYASNNDPCQFVVSCGQSRTFRSVDGRLCPPGHRLIRLPHSTFSHPARDCVPVNRRVVDRRSTSRDMFSDSRSRGGNVRMPACDTGFDGCQTQARSFQRGFRGIEVRPLRRNNCCF